MSDYGTSPVTIAAPRWQADANCAGYPVELFYPDSGAHDVRADGRRICAGCPVKSECLTFALETREAYGVWGGLSVVERAALLGHKLTGRSTLPTDRSRADRECDEDGCGRKRLTPQGLTLHKLRMHKKAS